MKARLRKSRPRRLDFICLQPTRQGQASYAHVNEIVAGLRRRGWVVRLIQPPLPRPGRFDGVRRAFVAAVVQFRYWVRCGFRPAPFVYIRHHFLALPSAMLAKAAGSVVVQEVNGPMSDTYDAWPQLKRLQPLLSLIARTQLRWADAVITVTPGLTDYVADLTGRRDRLYVVGNGADVDLFHPVPASAAEDRRRYVVFVGALASWQGIDTALDATETAEWPDDLDLVIAGDGKERGRVEAATRANPRVRWLGTIPYTESAALVSGSFAALVPMTHASRSQFGLSPLKLFEAMASGVPVIASDLPGLGDIVREHDCGITFTAGDAGALARAAARLVDHPDQAQEMGRRGRAAAVERYSWDARAGQTDEVLSEVGRGARAGRPGVA